MKRKLRARAVKTTASPAIFSTESAGHSVSTMTTTIFKEEEGFAAMAEVTESQETKPSLKIEDSDEEEGEPEAKLPTGKQRRAGRSRAVKGKRGHSAAAGTSAKVKTSTSVSIKAVKKQEEAEEEMPLDPSSLGYGGFPSSVSIGLSGCSYKHWHTSPARPQNFYSARVKAKDEFRHYSRYFNSLEINYAYYQLPTDEKVIGWRQRVPRDDYVFAVKAHRYFTHTKRSNCDEWFKKKWEVYHARWSQLGPHLGVVLFQFPNAFRCTDTTMQRIDGLGEYFKANYAQTRFAVEFRDVGWFKREVYEILKRWDFCLCALNVNIPRSDRNGSSWGDLPSGTWPPIEEYPWDVCTWGCYMRYHGATGGAKGSYGAEKLRPWALASSAWASQGAGRKVFVYFNNDASMDDQGDPANPSAVADALRMARLFRELMPSELGVGADAAQVKSE